MEKWRESNEQRMSGNLCTKDKLLQYFPHFSKLPKVNNRPIGENSPNLVTLVESKPKP
jgi:hypothetical protein